MGGDSEDQLSVALRIHLDTFRNVKEYIVALGVRGTTLNHKMTQTGLSWFEQVRCSMLLMISRLLAKAHTLHRVVAFRLQYFRHFVDSISAFSLRNS